MTHQFTIDPDGEGWLIECSCGWFDHDMSETGALNRFAQHEIDVEGRLKGGR